MKTSHCTALVLITWIAVLSTRIDAFLICNPNLPVIDKCRKVNETPKTPIFYRVCGDHLLSAYIEVCYPSDSRIKRKASDVLLRRESANRFLSSHHRVRRSFNAVEECCYEGCVPEELYEYCKY